MIDGRTHFFVKGPPALLALTFGAIPKAVADSRRNSLVIIFAHPLWNVSHSRISARLFAFSLDHSLDFIRMYSI